jgi:hypothetical protein
MIMKNHIDKSDIMKYVADLLPAEAKEKLEHHLLSCNTCVLKVAHGYVKMGEACEKVQALFGDYKSERLDKVKKDLVRQHLIICDNCNKAYDGFLNKVEQSSIEVLLKDLRQEKLENYRLIKEKTSNVLEKGKKPFLQDLPFYQYNKSGVNIGLSDNKQGNLMVYLKSEKYDVSNVSVSLGAKTKEGFNPIMTAVTTKKGAAILGRKDKLGTMEEDNDYSLYISGLKKKLQ